MERMKDNPKAELAEALPATLRIFLCRFTFGIHVYTHIVHTSPCEMVLNGHLFLSGGGTRAKSLGTYLDQVVIPHC